EGDQLGQGKENARNFLKDNPDLANEIERKIKEKLGVGVRKDAAADDAAAAAPAEATAVPAPASKAKTTAKAAVAKS
ncbi:DNA recombination/repair protein RecA, partial [Streptomyces sp. NPDC041003]